MGPEGTLALAGLDACTGWLGGLVFVVVGLFFLRKAHGAAGMLVGAAGGLKLILNCCAFWPELYLRFGGYDDTVIEMMGANAAFAQLMRLGVFALLAAGAALAANVLRARTGGAR